MLDPELTNVLPRRIGAAVVNALLIGIVTFLIGRSRVQTFTWTETDVTTGQPQWTAEQFEQLVALSQNFNRDFDRGMTKYVMTGPSLAITFGAAIILAALFFVFLPASKGWSPGQKLFGLRVTASDGSDLPLGRHAIRTVVGLVDLIPYVVPGLVGLIAATRSQFHQRLGDRAADSLVIDARRPVRTISADAWQRRGQFQAPPSRDPDSMVNLSARLGTAPVADEMDHPDDMSLPTGLSNPAGTGTPLDGGFDDGSVYADDGRLIDAPPPNARDLLGNIDDDPLPDMPPESHRVSATRAPWDEDDWEIDDPSTDPAPSDGLPIDEGQSSPPDSEGRGPWDDDASDWDEAPSSWETPLAEPAPVWHPTGTASSPRSSDKGDRPVAVTGADPATLGDGTASRPTSATESAQIHAQQSSDSGNAATSAGTSGGQRSAAAAGEPIWNDEWQAWLYWEPTARRWLRYDDAAGTWIAIS